MKTIAVILATFADYPYLVRCVNSVQSNTCKIRYFIQDQNNYNYGVATAYNMALKQAFEDGTDYFLFLHADVELTSDCIDELVTVIDSTGWYLVSGTPDSIVEWHLDSSPTRSGKRFLTYDPSTACFLIPRNTYEDIGYFDEAYQPIGYEFDDYLMQIFSKSGKFGRATHCVFKHNMHGVDEEWYEKNKFRFAQNKAHYMSKWKIDPSLAPWRENKFVIDQEN